MALAEFAIAVFVSCYLRVWIVGLISIYGLCSVATAAHVVPIMIYVDEEEATSPPAWRRRLSLRIKAASDIISEHADVRFSIVGYGVWRSDNRIQDLSKSLREFEQEIQPGTARLAIGFSSQYKFQSGRNHLGGTRGPLRHHILIRENASSIRESERLEVLVHELGHFLGAAHSKSSQSVMRPVVGDGQANAASFRITFDPQNSKIIRLIGREMRDQRVDRFQDLSPATLKQLREPYSQLARQLPEDLVARRFLYVINGILRSPPAAIDPSKVIIPVGPKSDLSFEGHSLIEH